MAIEARKKFQCVSKKPAQVPHEHDAFASIQHTPLMWISFQKMSFCQSNLSVTEDTPSLLLLKNHFHLKSKATRQMSKKGYLHHMKQFHIILNFLSALCLMPLNMS